MTPTEFRAELTATANEIGNAARVMAFITAKDTGDAIFCSVYPRGMSGSTPIFFHIYGNTFEETLANLRAKWAEFRAEFIQKIVSTMALAIIRIASEIGECSDAALRLEFTDDEIVRFGAEACTEANTMAGKGPFKITTAGANGAPSEALPEGMAVN